jgi:regulation of enolase protein 1 (concanavalin A-like superfamily)
VTITDNDTAAPAGTIAWTATTATVGEATSTVTLTARRSGGSSGAIGASWATANATASAGSDYTAASGTLAWGAGDTADKTVSITIANDIVVEAAETFTVALSAATGGATLGAATTVTVTIADDDSNVPSPWQTADVGSVAAAGSASESAGTWTVRGSGADIWGAADEFRFVWQELAGDGEVVARVTAIGNTHAWAKAGVMIRDGAAANAAHAMMVQTAGNGRAFQFRSATGGASRHVAGGAGPAPVWVKIARSGNVLTGSTSSDGIAWTMVGNATIAMGATVRVGLVVTSHLDGTLCTGTFTGVGVTPTGLN